jgi:hypothetical protein
MDNAKISLINCLINNKNNLFDYVKNICEFDVWNITLEIYFDYYAIIYPKYELFIYSQLTKWNELHDTKDIYIIYKLLSQSNHNNIVNQLKLYDGKIKKKPYLSFIKQFDDNYKNLFLSILKYNDYIYHYLLLLLEHKSAKEIYIELLLYFHKYFKLDCSIENIQSKCMPKWDNKLYENDAHYLLATIIHVISDDINPLYRPVKLISRTKELKTKNIKNNIMENNIIENNIIENIIIEKNNGL